MQQFTFGRKARKQLIAVLVVVVLGVPAFLLASRWANAPVQEAIQVANASQPVKPPELQPVRTTYFSTRLPGDWRLQENHDQMHPDKLQLVAFAPSGKSGQVAIVSDVLPTDGLSGVADYHLRTSSTAVYAPLADPGLPAGSKTFQKISGPLEYILFMSRGSRFASVTVTGELPPSDLLALLQQVLADWIWL